MLSDQLYCCFCLYSFSGLCVPSSYINLKWPKLYYFFMAFTDILVVLNGVTIFANAVAPRVPLSKRCYSWFTLIATTESICKIVACYKFKQRFSEYLKRWDVLIENECSDELKEAKLKNKHSNKRLFYGIFFLIVTPMIPWGSLPLFMKCISYIIPSLRTSYNFTAVPAQFPFDPLISPNFEGVAIFQGLAAVAVNSKLAAYDCMLYGLLTCLVVQLRNLKKELKELFHLPTRMSFNKDLRELQNERLKKWVARHSDLIQLTRSLNDLYSPLLLVKFSFVILLLCLGAFVVSSAAGTILEIVFSLIYIFLTIFQLFILCSLGEEIMHLSVSLADEAFWQEWFLCSPEMCESLKIVIENTKVPLKISAYGTFHLSVEIFNSVLKTAYSYFMFLNGIKKN